MTGPSFKWSGVVYLPHILGNVLSRRISNCVVGEVAWGPRGLSTRYLFRARISLGNTRARFAREIMNAADSFEEF